MLSSMMRSVCAAALAAATIPSAGAGPARAITAAASEASPGPEYETFVRLGASRGLIHAALKAYLSVAAGIDDFPQPPSPFTGRPAGPRDEPPPPEWPVKPVGLALCLAIDGRIRLCEGGVEPGADQLLEAITSLGERLATASGRARPRIGSEQFTDGELRAFFLLEPDALSYDEARAAGREGMLDLSGEGLLVEGSRGDALVMPGQADSLKRALRIARKAGALRIFGKPLLLVRFRAVEAGSGRLFTP